MRVLVDTCVIINVLQSRVPFAEAAQKLFIYSANKQKDYMKSSVKVYEPSALLKLLEEENQTE